MPHVFDPIRAKIGWAAKHSQAAEALSKTFLTPDFCTISMKNHDDGTHELFVVDIGIVPIEFGLIIGEALHQLGSCLDHIAFCFATPRPGKERQVQFPLEESWELFDKSRVRRMPCVSDELWATVESLQPYHYRKWPEVKLLRQLQELDNWDKHRMITATGIAVEGSSFEIINESGAIVSHESIQGILEPGAVIARITVKRGESGIAAKVKMKPILEMRPVFDSRMPKELIGVPVIPFVGLTGKFIRDTVIPMFEKFI
jgi:hypothetical protein